MKILGRYKNGNYKVTILEDGTKIRETEENEFIPEFPECMDVKITDKCDGGCLWCFVPQTKIQTVDGIKNIEDIKVGDRVYSMSESGDFQIKNVDQVFKREYQGELIEIITDTTSIQCTPNHKVYTENRGWIEAKDLECSDILIKFACE